MKNLIKTFLTVFIIITLPTITTQAADKYSKEYLQSKNHVSITKPFAESIVKKAIKKALKKETGVNFDVKFSGYTTASIKKGIFKSLELTGYDVDIDSIPIPYINLKTLSDYNYIDYTKNPIEYKSDINLSYNLLLSEDSINSALKQNKYQKTIKNVNKIAYPLFVINNVKTKIMKDKMYIAVDYNFPISKSSKDKTFVMISDFQVINGEIKAKNVHIDSAYGNIPLNKVTNLVNLLNPLEFTLKALDDKKCEGNIENVNIIDNKIKVDGKIFIKGD